MYLIQECIPGWDLKQGKRIPPGCKLIAKQFYFRLKTDQNPLLLYSNGPFDRNYDCIMATCHYLNYLDFTFGYQS